MTKALHTDRRLALLAGIVFALACAVAFAPGAGAEATKPSQVDVVGAGTIAWRQVAVLAKPKAGAARVAVLKQFRPDFRPQYVLALDAVRAKRRQGDVVPDQRPRPSRTGARAGCAQRLSSSTR